MKLLNTRTRLRIIQDIFIGEEFVHKVAMTEALHLGFMELSGDKSPIHTDVEFAKKNGFQACLGYAFLLPLILSKIYGMLFPGGSELCLRQDTNFPNPYYVGDDLTFRIVVLDKNDDLQLLTAMTTIVNQDSKSIFRGKVVFKLSLRD